MSTSMDGSDLPSATNACHVGQAALESADSAQPESAIDTSEPDLLHQLAAMQTRLDAAHLELAGAQLQIERLQAATLAPCPRCNFHAWSVRVQSSMGGQVHTIACPDGPATLIAHVKKELALCDPKWSMQHLLVSFLPFDASGSCSSSDADLANPAPLADDRTLASCGVSNGHLLELLVGDVEWSDDNRMVFETIQQCGHDATFTVPRNFHEDGAALAVSWALVNSINTVGIVDIELLFGINHTWRRIQGAASLGSALHVSTSIRIIDLSENDIGSDGAKSIGAALRVNTSLQTLALNENLIGTDGVEALADALKANRSLQELKIDSIGMNSAGAAYFFDALRLNSSLRFLSMDTNDIGEEGSESLSAALRVNSGLEYLSIRENQLGEIGTLLLSDALRVNVGLRTLHINSNEIGDAGAMALAGALRVNSTLTCMQLGHNAIGDDGAVALGDALCVNTALTTLDLIGNNIGALGVAAIRKAQRENPRLEPINMYGNPGNT